MATLQKDIPHCTRRPAPGEHVAPLRAVILLTGAVRPSPFQAAIGRSMIELPIEQGVTILDHWMQNVRGLTDSSRGSSMELRLIADRSSHVPAQRDTGRVVLKLDRDPSEFRGTGGILRDLAGDYAPDDLLLVVGGAQCLLRPLDDVVSALVAEGADAAIASHEDGTPGTLLLTRARCLASLPPIGFVDLKEQGLPLISRQYRVVVRTYRQWTCLPIRTEAQYISALRHHHLRTRATDDAPSPFEEDWDLRFRIVEPGAKLMEDVVVHDSVVLSGATVGRNATLVRSVVCPGARVPRGATIADTLLGPA